MRHNRITTTVVFLLGFMFCCSHPALAGQAPLLLGTAQQRIQAAFSSLDSSLKRAAAELGKTGLTGDAARQVLAATCAEYSFAVDCCTIDGTGRMLTVEPARYRRFEGKDIADQEQVKRMLKEHKPVFSQVFRAVEGYDAVDLEYPVFNPEGRFTGSVSILFKPEKLLGDIIRPVVKGMPLDIWVMEQGGRILYDVDTAQVGLNLFTSPLYAPYHELVRQGQQIAETGQGSGSYRFKKFESADLVTKQAHWQSVSLYGTGWRLVGIHMEPESHGVRTGRPAAATVAGQALETLAAQPSLQDALAKGDKDGVMEALKGFYEQTPGIYSVQLVDTKGVNRFGYPLENSLTGYDFHLRKAASDQQTIDILEKQQSALFEAPLFEGGTGIFIFRPVFRGGQYLGMLYLIKLKPE